jgi:hypothetical protein
MSNLYKVFGGNYRLPYSMSKKRLKELVYKGCMYEEAEAEGRIAPKPEPKPVEEVHTSAKDWVYGFVGLPFVTRNKLIRRYELLPNGKPCDPITDVITEVYETALKNGTYEEIYKDIQAEQARLERC